MVIKTRFIRNVGDFQILESVANRVEIDHSMSPMQDPIWYLSCAEALTDTDVIEVVAVEDDSNLLALAPMAREWAPLMSYSQIGVRALSEPSDFYYVDDAALDALVDALTRYKQPLTLGRIRSDSKSLAAIQRAFRRRGIVLTSSTSSCPYIDLQSLSYNLDEHLTPRLRQDLRRAEGKADSMGDVRFEMHSPRSDLEFLPLFDAAMRVEAAGWKGRAGTALLTDVTRRRFFRSYGIRASRKGILRISFLRIGEEFAAMQYAVEAAGRYWLLRIGYDERFSSCSPGMLLLHETLEYAARQGLQSYEFLGYPEPWIQRWRPLSRPTVRIDVCHSRTQCILALVTRKSQRLLGLIRQSASRRQ